MNGFGDLWSLAFKMMVEDLPQVTINTWIRYLEPELLTSDCAYFTVSEPLQKTVILGRYTDVLKKYLNMVLGFEPEISISCPTEGESVPDLPPGEVVARASTYEAFTFDSFVVGNSNKLAHAAALAVSERPGEMAYNPLFIYGDSGLGKTHLLYAIAHKLEQKFPNFVIKYVSADDFSNQLIEAINSHTTPEFRNRYRHVDVLLMDDVQFLSRTEATQEEVFHTMNALCLKGKQVILTSDRPPKEIPTIEDRLRSRFEQGSIMDVHRPDYETRVAILLRKAEIMNVPLTGEVVEYIATNLTDNIRQLEGAVKKMKVLILLGGSSGATIDKAQEAIKDLQSENEPLNVVVDRIIKETATFFNTDSEKLRGKSQNAEIVRARQVAMYLIREISGVPLTFIGTEFNRNHTTVGHSINKVEKEMESSVTFRGNVRDLRNNLRSNLKIK